MALDEDVEPSTGSLVWGPACNKVAMEALKRVQEYRVDWVWNVKDLQAALDWHSDAQFGESPDVYTSLEIVYFRLIFPSSVQAHIVPEAEELSGVEEEDVVGAVVLEVLGCGTDDGDVVAFVDDVETIAPEAFAVTGTLVLILVVTTVMEEVTVSR